jgi:hypothetical protein
MPTDSTDRWLGVYKTYLVIATVLCVISPVMYVFRVGISDLPTLGSYVIRMFVFAAAVATASRLAEPTIRNLPLSLNAAAAILGLAYVFWKLISLLPFFPEILRTLGSFVIVPWSVIVPMGLYKLYPVMSVFGLLAASIWTYFLATQDVPRPALSGGHIGNDQVPGNHQAPLNDFRAIQPRRDWRPLLIAFLIALAINVAPIVPAVITDEFMILLLWVYTVPAGLVILLIGLIWSLIRVSQQR